MSEVTQHCEAFFEAPLVRRGEIVAAVANFHTVQPFVVVERRVYVEPCAPLFTLPALVVPKDKGVLFVGLFYGFYKILGVQGVDVVEENGVEVARRSFAGDFGRADEQDVHFACPAEGQLVRPVVISGDIVFVRLVFDMVANGKYVENLAAMPRRPVWWAKPSRRKKTVCVCRFAF